MNVALFDKNFLQNETSLEAVFGFKVFHIYIENVSFSQFVDSTSA